MAVFSYTYSFSNGSTADADQVNQNFTDVRNGVSDGTKDISVSALTAAGTATFNGNVTLGNASADDITFTGSLASTIPIKTTNTYNIGSSTLGLASVYFGANSQTVRVLGSASMSATYTLTLPVATGAANTVMYTSGSGVLAFGSLTNAMVDASAAIAGTKISPDFGSGNILTTSLTNGIGNGGAASPEAYLHIEGNLGAPAAQPSILIRDRDSTVDSNNYLLWLDYSVDSDCTGGRFATFHDAEGQIGSISAATATTVAYNTSSDARLKENIVPLTGSLDRVKALKPSAFTWKRNGQYGEGFIAQELQQVVPYAVSGDAHCDLSAENASPLGVDYGKLTTILAGAIQELVAKVERLEKELAKHKTS